MALSAEWRKRITNWVKILGNLCYRPLGQIVFEGFTTLEQLTFEQAQLRVFEPMPPGTKWGAKWEYGWFKAKIMLPDTVASQWIVLRMKPGGDSLVWINGQIAGSQDSAHTEITLMKNGIPGSSFDILAESYAGHGTITDGGDPIPYGVETVPEPGPTQTEVEISTYGIWEEEIYQLWIDAQTLLELRDQMDPLSLRVAEIDQGLQDMTLITDLELPQAELMESVRQGRERLKPLLSCVNGSTMPIFFTVGHAHLDVAWLWPLQETERKIARTIANQIALMDEYPEYIYNQSQAHLFTMLKDRYPELFEKAKAYIQSKQIAADGATWVEPDTNIPSGESLIRQFIHGKRYFREEFGINCEVFWEPDVFGYSGALPQIMKGCGIKYFYTQKIMWTYSGGDRFPYNLFIWEGIDGSEVLAHIGHGYGYETSPAKLIRAWTDRSQMSEISTVLVPFGWSDGGGGPTRDHLEFLRRVKDLEGAPRVRMASPMDYFTDIESRGRPKARYVGELYYQAHRGTYTTQARTKKNNRKCEWALREAEFWSVIAQSFGKYTVRRQAFDNYWKTVLLNQFHDILPGSSIARVYEETERMHAHIIRGAQEIIDESVSKLCQPGQAVMVFNSLAWSRKVLVEAPVKAQGMKSITGELLVMQMLPDKRLAEVELPACGWTTLFYSDDRTTEKATLEADSHKLENEYLRVEFNESGEIRSLFDKESERELLSDTGNVFHLFKDVPGHFDAWDIDRMTSQMPVNLDRKAQIELLYSGPLMAAIRVRRQLHNSTLEQEVSLRRGSRRIDFKTKIDWQERHKLLKVSFPVTIHANEAIHEIQFGHIRRPNHASRPFDADRFEVANQKWSALVEENRGVALLNDCKYGISVQGKTMSLTLLKSAMAPDMRADLGNQEFTYSFYSWNGNLADSRVVQEAYELNCPLTVVEGSAGEASLLSIDKPNIILETLKPAEDGSTDLVLRLYESMRMATRCIIKIALPVASVIQTDMLEQFERELPLVEGKVELDFRAFEIKTLRMKLMK